jgi:hypothetical protein
MNRWGYVAVAAMIGVGCVRAAQAHVFVGMTLGVPVAPVVSVYASPSPLPYYYAPPPPVVTCGCGYQGPSRYAADYWR